MVFFVKIFIFINLLIFVCPLLILGAEDIDPAMEFYLGKIDSVLNSSTLFDNNLKSSVSLKSIYVKLNYRGIVSESDTANFLGSLLNGEFIKSQIIDTSYLDENIVPAKLQFEKPWIFNCRFYFFPRDTGAGDLAIGFVPADTLDKKAPEGIIIINRDTYRVKNIYLHYLNIEDYEWLSKSYQFVYENDISLLKSLTIQGCYYGFFQRRFFRQDLIFDNYDFQEI
ncbi:MAG: hypothetical protein GY865_18250 [candidate division Zixibacteria bacterium]|nr:hypothetical protein [candidate division Zixibacteria bacterium]